MGEFKFVGIKGLKDKCVMADEVYGMYDVMTHDIYINVEVINEWAIDEISLIAKITEVIQHEVIHKVLFREEGVKACREFDIICDVVDKDILFEVTHTLIEEEVLRGEN